MNGKTGFAVCLVLLAPAGLRAQGKVAPEAADFFEKRVRPVLAEHCFACHGAKKQQAGLRLDTPAFLKNGSDGGPVIVPGQPDKSVLVQAIRHQGDVKMPPKGRLPEQAIADLSAWVKMGAPWPDAGTLAKGDGGPEAWRKHWAFQPVKNPPVPKVKELPEGASPIDAFVLAALEAKGLKMNPPADRRTLIRR